MSEPGLNQLTSIVELVREPADPEEGTRQRRISKIYLEAKGNGFNPSALRRDHQQAAAGREEG